MQTPWGRADMVTKLEEGIYSVETSGHGGVMIVKSIANNILTESAIKRGQEFGNFICYEEDCDYAIPMYELKKCWDKYFAPKEETEIEQILIKSLSMWNPEYLIERGIPVSEKEYNQWYGRQLEEKMRKENHPDLIVCAWGEWHTNRVGITEVETADGKSHFVKSNSYDCTRNPNLLSMCEIVE